MSNEELIMKTLEDLKNAPIGDVMAVVAASLVGINNSLAKLLQPKTETVTVSEPEDIVFETRSEGDAPTEEAAPEIVAPEEPKTHNLDDIRGLLRQCTSKGIPDKGKAVLKNRGCAKVSDLKDELIDTVFEELTQLLEGVA